MPMTPFEYFNHLRRTGCSFWDAAYRTTRGGVMRVVTGTNGENVIETAGSTSAEAWSNAVEQARELGMLRGRGDDAIEDRRKW